MAEKYVRDIYHKGIIFCHPNTPLQEVVAVMAETDVHAVIVATEDETKPLGVILHIDAIAYYGRDLTQVLAQDVMQAGVKSVTESVPVADAAKMMVDGNVWRLLVVGDNDVPLGIISTTDVIRSMRSSKWVWYKG